MSQMDGSLVLQYAVVRKLSVTDTTSYMAIYRTIVSYCFKILMLTFVSSGVQ